MHYKRLLCLILAVVLAACGGGGSTTAPTQPAGEAPTTAPAEQATQAPAGNTDAPQVDTTRLSQELHVYNWADYIDESILEDFEKEYGVSVVVDIFPSNEEMIAKVKAGSSGYDIVFPSDYAVQQMSSQNLLATLDKSLLPNLAHLDPGLLNKYFDEGNVYSLPYMYGISGIAYNKQALADLGVAEPDSWAALFDPAQAEKYAGKFSMLDDERETIGAALKYLGKSLNDTDPASLKQAEELLVAQKPLLAAYNSSDVNRKLAGGEYVIAHCWSGDAMQARNGLGEEFPGNADIAFVMPKEGGMIWMDTIAILADSPNAYTAHVFIDYLMRPEIAARNTEYIGFLTPNKDAVPMLSDEIKQLYAAGFAPSEEMYARLEWAVRDDSSTTFSDVWTVVKGE